MPFWRRAMVISSIACLSPVVGCKAQPRAQEEPEEMAVRAPSPVGGAATYGADDEVSYLADDGSFEIDAHVIVAASQVPRGGGKATKGYDLRVGSGRSQRRVWAPIPAIFPAPWATSLTLTVGETVVQRSFGDFKPTKCTVTQVSADPHERLMATCEGSNIPKSLERKDTFRSFEPAPLDSLTEGDIVYFDNMYWAMVVGKNPNKAIIREAGFASRDKQVDASRLQKVK